MKNVFYLALMIYVLFIIVYTVVGRIIRKKRYAKIIREYEINFEIGSFVKSKKRKKFHKR